MENGPGNGKTERDGKLDGEKLQNSLHLLTRSAGLVTRMLQETSEVCGMFCAIST